MVEGMKLIEGAFGYITDMTFMGQFCENVLVGRANLFTMSEIDRMTDDEYKLYNALLEMGLRQTAQIIAAFPNDRMEKND